MKHSLFNFIRQSFTLKLIIVFVLSTLGTALALNYYFLSKVRQEFHNDLVARGQSLTRLLAGSSRLGVFTGIKKDLEGPAGVVYQEHDCKKLVIYDWEGTALVSLGSDAAEYEALFSSRTLSEQMLGHGGAAVNLYPEHGAIVFGQAILAGQTVSEDDMFLGAAGLDIQQHRDREPIGYVVVLFSTEEMTSKIWNILQQNLIATLMIVLFSSLCLLQFVKRLTKPLKILAREIVKHRGANTIENEQAELLGDFSEMINIIQESYRTISELKDNLEKKIQERTVELSLSNTALEQQKITLERLNAELGKTVADLQQSQDQLIQSEKMAALGQLLGGISHEINNALNFITGALPLLDRNLRSISAPSQTGDLTLERQDAQKFKAQNRTLLDNIMEGVRRISGLTNNLRVFGYTNPEDFSRSDIHPGLAACIGIVRSKYGKHIEIKEEFAQNLPEITCNIGQLNQVFMNLLLNAAQSIHEQGTITVKTSFVNNQLLVTFCDTGEGISAERLGRVFDPFYTTKKIGEGTGLGLSISYTIIHRHGGKIDIDSKPGEGTTFEITLPIICAQLSSESCEWNLNSGELNG
nr:sensor histidine kinase [Desulfobulbaceae bacterium]